MPKYSPAPLFVALILTVLLVGCGSDDSRAAPVGAGPTIDYGSFGSTADIDCGQGKSLNVGGSNNTLQVTGACASVSISGADNKITVERIDGFLSVAGLNNTVSYQQGEPTVNDEGTGNRISGA